jgi:hypothetical protein
MRLSTTDFIKEYMAFDGNTNEFHKYLLATYDGYPKSSFATYSRIKRLKARGELELDAGVSVESGQVLTGISRYHKLEDGGVWVKSNTSLESQLDAFKAAVEDITSTITPAELVPVPDLTLLFDEMLTIYPMPDLHLGLYVDASSSGNNLDWDIDVAVATVKASMSHLVKTSPSSRNALIVDLGDFLHANDDSNRTKSGHILDVDGKHASIVRASFDLLVNVIDEALTKHEIVTFYSVGGNHSEDSSIYLKAFLSAWYKDEPRVIINSDNALIQYYKFGSTLLGFTHGHTLKPKNIAETLVIDNTSVFSDTEFRYVHLGHFHHNETVEGKVCTTEVHKNLPPADAWAQSIGYRNAIGQAKSITYHKELGEINRSIFNIKMMKD